MVFAIEPDKAFTLADVQVGHLKTRVAEAKPAATLVRTTEQAGEAPVWLHKDRRRTFELRPGVFYIWPQGKNVFTPVPDMKATCIAWRKGAAAPEAPVEYAGFEALYNAVFDAAESGLQIKWPEGWQKVEKMYR